MGSKSDIIKVQRAWNWWRIAGCIFAALTLVLFAALLMRGLDLTDEGFYLNWTKHPWEYTFFLTATGFFFHPLALIFPDDIVAWRLVAGVMVLGSGFVFGCGVGSYAYRLLPKGPNLPVSALFFLSIVALFFYSWWLPSPGYNLLNFAGCLLFASGLLFSVGAAGRSYSPRMLSSAALTSFGAIAIWMARPSTVFPMALFAMVFLAVHKRREAFVSVMWAAFLTFIFSAAIAHVIGGSFQGLIARYGLGFDLISLLRPPFLPSVKDQFWYTFSYFDWAFFLGATAIAVVVVQLGGMNKAGPFVHLFVALALIAVSICIGVTIAADEGNRSVARLIPLTTVIAVLAAYILRTSKANLAFITVLFLISMLVWQGLSSVLAMVILASSLLALIGRSLYDDARAAACWTALLLCWIPIAFGFGSGNAIDLMSGLASVFWIGAAFLIAIALFPTTYARLVEWIGVGYVFATFAALVGAASHPYRLMHPLWEQSECVSIRHSSLPICLDPASASYFQRIEKAAIASGFERLTPIIDLTGTAPTTIFVLDGLPIGSAWLLGGYPNSEEFTRRALETVPRDQLSGAWVLTAPKGHRSIPDTVMRALGLNFPSAYTEVVESHTEYEDETHILWKPILK
ncbi:hypothetical protein [Bradyrhizobium sp. WSM1417]|uniref:hypothetical protein n=1 Tax=Bradyrhizobium sp. WSM1417 TaxID=754500 RepID=UPI0012EC7C19|nr:hypothetical protein [Bradyrhizobium sp. WSM1417]